MKNLLYIILSIPLITFILGGVSKGDDLENCWCEKWDKDYNCIKCSEEPFELDEVTAVGDASKSKKKECPGGCCGIKLNTNFPIIGNCIGGKGKTDSTTAFPTMIGALTKIVMSLVLVACFILIIYAGILWSADRPKEARPILRKVAITILLLGFSGVILRLINPNFFS